MQAIITPEEMALPGGRSEEKMRQLLVVIKKSSEEKRRDTSQEPKTPTNVIKPVRSCTAKGSGLVVGLVSKRCKFVVNIPSSELLDLHVDIRGPDETYCYERITSLVQHRSSISEPSEDTILVGSLEAAALSSSRRNSVLSRSESTNSDKSGTGLRIPFDHQYMEDDNFVISYIPRCSGVHVISVKWHKKHVKGSPFRANIAETVEKLNQGSKGRITQQNIMPDIQTEPLTDPLNSVSQTLLGTKGLFPTISNVARLTKQATITRRRVLRRVFTKGGQEVVIHEASDSSRQNSADALSRQNSRDNSSRPGSPSPNNRFNHSFDFEIGYDSDASSKGRAQRRQVSLAAKVQQQKPETVHESKKNTVQNTPTLLTVGKMASDMADEIVKDAIDSSKVAKNSHNMQGKNEETNGTPVQPIKWTFHGDLKRRTSTPLVGNVISKHENIRMTSSVPYKTDVGKSKQTGAFSGKGSLSVPQLPEREKSSPHVQASVAEKKLVGKSLSHNSEKLHMELVKSDVNSNSIKKNENKKLSNHRKICGTFSEPLGAKDKVRNWLEKSSPEAKDEKENRNMSFVPSPQTSDSLETACSETVIGTSGHLIHRGKKHSEKKDSVAVKNAVNDSKFTPDMADKPVQCQSIKTTGSLIANNPESTVTKLIQSKSLRKSCFYISQGALVESPFQSQENVTNANSKEQEYVTDKRNANQGDNKESDRCNPKLESTRHTSLRLSRSLPSLSKAWNAFELDPDEDIKEKMLEIYSKEQIQKKRATLGSSDLQESVHELQRLRIQSNLVCEDETDSVSSLLANPASAPQSLLNSESGKASPTASDGKSGASSRRSSLLRHDVISLHRVSEESSFEMENLESIHDQADIEPANRIYHSIPETDSEVEEQCLPSTSMVSVYTQVHAAEIKQETNWKTPFLYLKRKKNPIRIGEDKQLKPVDLNSNNMPQASTININHGNDGSRGNSNDNNLQPVRQSTVETVDSGIADDHHIISLRELIASRLNPRMLSGHRIVTRRSYRGKITLDPRLVQNNLSISGEDDKENYLGRSGIRRWTKAASDLRKQRRKTPSREASVSTSEDTKKILKSKKGRNRRVMFSRRIMMYRRSSSRSSRSSKHSRDSKSPMHSLSLQDDSIPETPEPFQANPMAKAEVKTVTGDHRTVPKKNVRELQWMSQPSRGSSQEDSSNDWTKTMERNKENQTEYTCSCLENKKRAECRKCNQDSHFKSDTGEDSGIIDQEQKDEQVVKSDVCQLDSDEKNESNKNVSNCIPNPFSNLPVDNLHDIVQRLDLFCELTENRNFVNNNPELGKVTSIPDFLHSELGEDYISFTGLTNNNCHCDQNLNRNQKCSQIASLPDPSEVRVFGQNIQVGSVGVPNSFQVK